MIALALVAFVALAPAPDVIEHDVVVSVDPAAGTLRYTDRLRLPRGLRDLTLELHAGLQPSVEGGTIHRRATDGALETLSVRADSDVLVVHAAGRIVHPPVQVSTEHQRSFQETDGTIDPRGVYLSPASRWLPAVLDDDGAPLLVTGRVQARVPAGWRALCEGAFDEAAGTWSQPTPTEGLHLIAGPFTTFHAKKRGVDVLVWLRKRDDGQDAPDARALAERYLEVTGQYLEQYETLIGKYPYAKFALVENFWETGYGMPSFTVLGSQVLRFPFILHTSWPHELLHNWWGNGVFPKGGNWTEGLTAYLADHLHDEQQGRGAEHRRAVIQRFLDFVAVDPARDFPLVDFRGRFSASSEAVGYGKTMMLFHMLRRHLGDEGFTRALQRLWSDHRFARASFDDVRAAFAAANPGAGDLRAFFSAWTTQTGAPTLRLVEVSSSRGPLREGGRRRVSIVVAQMQDGPPFPMDVPFVVTTVDGRTVSSVLSLRERTGRATIEIPEAVARVDVDPFFDVFRTLSPDEVPPAFSRALGAPKMLFVTPTFGSEAEKSAWVDFARALCPDPARCTIVDDKKVSTLPDDAAVWILGYGSDLRGGPFVSSKPYGARLDDRGLYPPGAWERVKAAKDKLAASRAELFDSGKTDLAVVVEHPRDRRLAMAFVAASQPSHIPLLAKKLPHYGKYGYLGFTGDAVENTLKGQWSSTTSPLSFVAVAGVQGKLREPAPLAKLPPPFDGDEILARVRALADPALQGRATGTPGGRRALDLLVQMSSDAGAPTPRVECAPDDDALCNVVIHVPGTDPSLPRVVLGAHYDHLGVSGTGKKAAAFAGADDNASGVAVAIEVAARLARSPGLRSVDVVLFAGEEQGRRGSKSFVAMATKETPSKAATETFFAMVNLDTVGRLAGRKLLVLDGDSASEWVHAFRGVSFTTGVATELAPQGGGASDQQSFLDVGVPAVQLCSGPHGDYHKPSDTADKVEATSLVQAAVVAREIVGWLRDRREPLHGRGSSSSTAGAGARTASLGSVPDMTFAGPGVRFDDVVAGSPAALAGLRAGDVLVRFDGQPVADLKGYSELLKTKKPGDRVQLTVRRGAADVVVEVVLDAR